LDWLAEQGVKKRKASFKELRLAGAQLGVQPGQRQRLCWQMAEVDYKFPVVSIMKEESFHLNCVICCCYGEVSLQ
jgi:hypothetical protein